MFFGSLRNKLHCLLFLICQESTCFTYQNICCFHPFVKKQEINCVLQHGSAIKDPDKAEKQMKQPFCTKMAKMKIFIRRGLGEVIHYTK